MRSRLRTPSGPRGQGEGRSLELVRVRRSQRDTGDAGRAVGGRPRRRGGRRRGGRGGRNAPPTAQGFSLWRWLRSLFGGAPRKAERPAPARPAGAAPGTSASEQRVLEDFQKHYNVRFHRPELLTLALTHRSYLSVTGQGPNDSNERLEFLGDSVLGLVTSEHLYREHPGEHEGELTKIKSLLVSKNILSRRALNMGLGRFVLMSHSEAESGGRQRLSILADAFESVIGAIYLDQGFEDARRWIHRWLLDDAVAISADKRHTNYKSQLQEYVQSTFHTHPVYRIRNAMGPDHSKMFMVEVVVRNKTLGSGKGNNKKEAEQAAARDALDRVGVGSRPTREERSGGESERPRREERPSREERGAREERPSREERGAREERPSREERGAREERPSREERGAREERSSREERGAREERPSREERGAREERPSREERGGRDDRGSRGVRREAPAAAPSLPPPPPLVTPAAALPAGTSASSESGDEHGRRRRGRRGGRGRRGAEGEVRPAGEPGPVGPAVVASGAFDEPHPVEIEPVPPAHEEDENEEVGRPEGPHGDDDIGYFESGATPHAHDEEPFDEPEIEELEPEEDEEVLAPESDDRDEELAEAWEPAPEEPEPHVVEPSPPAEVAWSASEPSPLRSERGLSEPVEPEDEPAEEAESQYVPPAPAAVLPPAEEPRFGRKVKRRR